MSDFTTPEEFKPVSGVLSRSTIPLVLLGTALVFALWLLFAIIVYALKWPSYTSWLLAIGVAALIVGARFANLRRQIGNSTLTLSPAGMTYVGDHSRRTVAWTNRWQLVH